VWLHKKPKGDTTDLPRKMSINPGDKQAQRHAAVKPERLVASNLTITIKTQTELYQQPLGYYSTIQQ